MARVIALDASALIAHLDRTDAHHRRITQFLLDHAEQDFVASVVSLVETLVAPARSGRLDEASSLLSDLGVRSIQIDGAAFRSSPQYEPKPDFECPIVVSCTRLPRFAPIIPTFMALPRLVASKATELEKTLISMACATMYTAAP